MKLIKSIDYIAIFFVFIAIFIIPADLFSSELDEDILSSLREKFKQKSDIETDATVEENLSQFFEDEIIESGIESSILDILSEKDKKEKIKEFPKKKILIASALTLKARGDKQFPEKYSCFHFIKVKRLNPDKGRMNFNLAEKLIIIKNIAEKHGIDPSDLYGLLSAESWNLDIFAIGDHGKAFGVAQINFDHHPYVSQGEAFNFSWSVNFAARLLNQNGYQRNSFNAIRRYNGSLENPETFKYAKRVCNLGKDFFILFQEALELLQNRFNKI